MQRALWSAVKDRFELGTLPDIHILRTTREDWEKFIEFVASPRYVPVMTKAGKDVVVQLPDDFPAISDDIEMPVLRFNVAGLLCNCFFWRDEQIEFDVDAREMKEEIQFDKFLSFLGDVRDLVGRDILLTDENASFDDVIYPLIEKHGELAVDVLPKDVIVWLPALKGSESHGR